MTPVGLYTMYFDSTGGATALPSKCSRGDNAGALVEFEPSEYSLVKITVITVCCA